MSWHEQAGSSGPHWLLVPFTMQPTPAPQHSVPPNEHAAPWNRQTPQAHDPPAHGAPSCVPAQLRPSQQPDWLVQEPPIIAHDWQVPLQTRPRQHSVGELQVWPEAVQVSHRQPTPPEQRAPPGVMQCRAGDCVQQSALCVHVC